MARWTSRDGRDGNGKSAAESSPDGRRRLSILRVGSWIGLGPVAALAVYAVFSQRVLFDRVPPALSVTALLLLPIFPLTLGYVIVVERAMDLRFVIRTGMKYGLARFGLWAVRAAMVGLGIYILVVAERHGFTSWQPAELAAAAGKGFELMFFPHLREEMRNKLEESPHVLRFHGLRGCVKQLSGAERWNRRCQNLNDQIVEYLRSCWQTEQASLSCALIVV